MKEVCFPLLSLVNIWTDFFMTFAEFFYDIHGMDKVFATKFRHNI